jgi:hypothetical protein
MRAGHVGWQFGRGGPPASLSSAVARQDDCHLRDGGEVLRQEQWRSLSRVRCDCTERTIRNIEEKAMKKCRKLLK